MLLLAAVAVVSLLRILFLATQQDWGALRTPLLWLAGALALLVWSVVGNALFLPPSARKQLSRDKSLQGEMKVAWNSDYIRLIDVHGESQWPWGDLYKWQESPGGLLLWLSDRRYYYFPKRSLTEPQLVEVRETLNNSAKPA